MPPLLHHYNQIAGAKHCNGFDAVNLEPAGALQ
jgi:hypothetical protein